MSNPLFLLQFLFYIAICFIVATIMRGWIGMICGLLGGGMALFLLILAMNGGMDSYQQRGN